MMLPSKLEFIQIHSCISLVFDQFWFFSIDSVFKNTLVTAFLSLTTVIWCSRSCTKLNFILRSLCLLALVRSASQHHFCSTCASLFFSNKNCDAAEEQKVKSQRKCCCKAMHTHTTGCLGIMCLETLGSMSNSKIKYIFWKRRNM